MTGKPAPPPLRNTLREGLAAARVLINPLRSPSVGPQIGNGRAALVIPGLAASDFSTRFMRRTLESRGFAPEGWRLGLNKGLVSGKLARLEARIEELHQSTGKPVVLIGWSLGGLYARVLAHRRPDAVDMVVTLGTPFSGDRRANVGWKLYEAWNDHKVDNPPFPEDVSAKPPVPTIAVWSPRDGIVLPECSHGNEGEADYTLRIDRSHIALATSRRAIGKWLEKIAEVDAARG